jgi:hypothetical protein
LQHLLRHDLVPIATGIVVGEQHDRVVAVRGIVGRISDFAPCGHLADYETANRLFLPDAPSRARVVE